MANLLHRSLVFSDVTSSVLVPVANQHREDQQRKSGAVTTREVCLNDYEGIARLQAKYGLRVGSYEAWSHLWLNNPLYRKYPGAWPLGWVLDHSESGIVGYLGNIPLLYTLAGRHLTVATGRGFVVDAPFRNHSFLLLDRFFRQANVDLHLNTTVNAQAAKAYAIFRVRPVPTGAWDASAFWITGYRGFMRSLLLSKGFSAGNSLGIPLTAIAWLRDSMKGSPLPRNDSLELQPTTSFDDRFDRFWERLTASNKLLAFRNRDTLEWHFKYALQQQRLWILTTGSARQIQAYSIFLRDDNPKFGLKRVRLIDFQTSRDDYSELLPMLRWMFDRCRKTGVDMLEIVGASEALQNLIQPFAAYQRKLPSWLYFYRTKDDGLARVLNNPAVWNPSGYDGDSSL